MYDSSNTVNSWLVHSGGLRHITPNKLEFTVYVKFQKPQNAAINDGRVVDAKGIGNIQLSVKLKHQVQKESTSLQCAMKENLFSVRFAASRGMVVQFDHGRCKILGKANQVHAIEF